MDQMGFINNDVDTFTPGIKISFGSIDLVDDQLGDLLFDPKPIEQEKETPIPSSCSLPHWRTRWLLVHLHSHAT